MQSVLFSPELQFPYPKGVLKEQYLPGIMDIADTGLRGLSKLLCPSVVATTASQVPGVFSTASTPDAWTREVLVWVFLYLSYRSLHPAFGSGLAFLKTSTIGGKNKTISDVQRRVLFGKEKRHKNLVSTLKYLKACHVRREILSVLHNSRK